MRLRSYLRGLGIGIVVTALLMGATTKTEPMSDAQIKEKARALGMTEKGEQVLSEAMSPGSSVSVDKPKIELLEFPDKVSENESKGEKSSDSSSAKEKSEEKTSNSSSVKEKSEEKTSSSSSVKEKSEEKSSGSSSVKEKSEEKSSSSSSVKEKETSSSKKSSSSSSVKEKETSSSKKSTSSSSSLPKIDPESAKPTTPAPDGYVSITVVGGESSTMVASRLKEAGLISDAAAFDRFLCDNGYDRRITTGHKMIPRGASQVEIAGILTVR